MQWVSSVLVWKDTKAVYECICVCVDSECACRLCLWQSEEWGCGLTGKVLKSGFGQRGGGKKTKRKSACVRVCVCLSERLLNSCVRNVCQMALCNLLLHNQNTDSHFHAHALRHQSTHAERDPDGSEFTAVADTSTKSFRGERAREPRWLNRHTSRLEPLAKCTEPVQRHANHLPA